MAEEACLGRAETCGKVDGELVASVALHCLGGCPIAHRRALVREPRFRVPPHAKCGQGRCTGLLRAWRGGPRLAPPSRRCLAGDRAVEGLRIWADLVPGPGKPFWSAARRRWPSLREKYGDFVDAVPDA
jgi:hypothetical protein